MAYVPTYIHDVFVSYARVDNDGPRWVTQFRHQIESELRQELAVWGGRRVAVWFDETDLSAGDLLSESIRTALAKTAVLVRLLSPGYLSSAYCGAEAATFRKINGSGLAIGTRSRLLDIIIRPSDQLTGLLAGSVFCDLSQGGSPAAFDHAAFPRTAFQQVVRSTADLLKGMRARCPAVYVSLPSAGSTLLEGKITSMLEDLSQAGYRRTSETHPMHYASDSILEDEIRSALMSIHLVDDPDDDLVVRQVEAAVRTRTPIAVWLSNAARSSKHPCLEMIRSSGIEYSEENLSDFCERVKVRLALLRDGLSDLRPVRAPGQPRKIFVLFHTTKDKAAADSVIRRIEAESFTVAKPGRGADRELKASDGVLLYQKGADDEWFDSKLHTINGVKAVKAVCIVDPPVKHASRSAAQDYKFERAREVPTHDPRLLLEGDDAPTLSPFLQAVRMKGA